MSRAVFEGMFSFTGRRNRKSYVLLTLAQLGGLFGASILIALALALVGSAPILSYVLFFAAVGLTLAMCISGWSAGSQRIRDFGYSGVWILLTLVPYVGWLVVPAICFIPSSAGDNEYGPSQI